MTETEEGGVPDPVAALFDGADLMTESVATLPAEVPGVTHLTSVRENRSTSRPLGARALARFERV